MHPTWLIGMLPTIVSAINCLSVNMSSHSIELVTISIPSEKALKTLPSSSSPDHSAEKVVASFSEKT